MDDYKVVVHKKAQPDIDSIIDCLNTLSPLTADNQYNEFTREIDSLAFMPLRCPPARDESLAKRGYHYLIVRHYLVFFTNTSHRKSGRKAAWELRKQAKTPSSIHKRPRNSKRRVEMLRKPGQEGLRKSLHLFIRNGLYETGVQRPHSPICVSRVSGRLTNVRRPDMMSSRNGKARMRRETVGP